MCKLLNTARVNVSAPSYRSVQPGSVTIAESFSEELKLELYLHRHYSSQELLARFTARNSESARPAASLAIAKLLFGLDKTIEYAEARVKAEALETNSLLVLP